LPACCEPSLISFFRPVSHCIFLHLHKMWPISVFASISFVVVGNPFYFWSMSL
jgi:hypothetical protein